MHRAAMRKRALPSVRHAASFADQESTMPNPALLPPNTERCCSLSVSRPSAGESVGDQPTAASPGLSTLSSAGSPRAGGADAPQRSGAGRRGSRRPARAMSPGGLWIARASRPRGGAANGGGSLTHGASR